MTAGSVPAVSQPGQVGRRLRATYAFGGARAELDRTVPVEPGEQVLLRGAMRLRGVGLLPRPVVLRLTRCRLAVLAHYAFRPDQVWDLPRDSIRTVQVVDGAVEVSWASADETAVLALAGWTGRAALDRPLHDVPAVADELLAWLASPDGDLPGNQPPGHRLH